MSCDLAPMGEVILHMPSTDNDSFAKKLEFEVLESRFGYSRVKGRVKPEFLNGLGIAHGGACVSLQYRRTLGSQRERLCKLHKPMPGRRGNHCGGKMHVL